MPPTRADLTLLGVVAGIAIAGVIATQVERSGATYPAGSPRATVQELLHATSERDPAALDLVDPALGCTARNVAVASMPRDLRVELLDATVTGSTARVEVRMTQESGGVFDVGWAGLERTESFGLDLASGRWLITEMSWPLRCEGGS